MSFPYTRYGDKPVSFNFKLGRNNSDKLELLDAFANRHRRLLALPTARRKILCATHFVSPFGRISFAPCNRRLYISRVQRKATERRSIRDAEIRDLSVSLGWTGYYTVGWVQTWLEDISAGRANCRGSACDISLTLPGHMTTAQPLLNALVNCGIVRKTGDIYDVVASEDLARKRLARQSAGRLGGIARKRAIEKRTLKAAAKTVKPAPVPPPPPPVPPPKPKPKRKRKPVADSAPAPATLPLKANGAPLVTMSDQAPTSKLWTIYAAAYEQRYSVPPLRNATTNSQMKALLCRIGIDDMPGFLQFYVDHPDYRRVMHTIGAALKSAESLHSQFMRNRPTLQGDLDLQLKGDAMQAQIARIQNGEVL